MLLELKNIEKKFPVKKGFLGKTASFVQAVNNIDLSIEAEESLGLVGESGCGKTTLARMILRLMDPDQGTIHFNGEDVTQWKGRQCRKLYRNIQLVFQDPYSSLDPRYPIRKVLEEVMQLDPVKFDSQSHKELRMNELLQAVNLSGDVLSRFPHEFSGGERQRIAIARALILNPKLVILDEAVSSLDVIIQKQLIDLLAELQSKFSLTYFFISHNLKVVRKVCQNIAVMYQGKIVELGKAEEIFNNPLHPYTRELLEAAMHYKAVPRETPFDIHPQAGLVDQGDGHFLISD